MIQLYFLTFMRSQYHQNYTFNEFLFNYYAFHLVKSKSIGNEVVEIITTYQGHNFF